MSGYTRNLDKLPTHCNKLTTKQKRNWRRNTRKIERNEQLREQYPPYHPMSNINVIHIHRQPETHTIDQVIHQAKATHRYTLDTESQTSRFGNTGALVQIEMIHSTTHSTILLFETYHLPDADSSLIEKIQQLWSIIFNSGNEIITWGSIDKEFQDCPHIE